MKHGTRIAPLTVGLLAASTLIVGCGGSNSATQGTLDTTPTTTIPIAPNTIMEFLQATPELSTVAGLVATAGLTDTFSRVGTYTLFAPTNDAFNALGADRLAELTASPATLKQILMGHTLSTELDSIDILEGTIETLSGSSLEFAIGGDVTVNGAKIVGPDHRMTNGVVHEVDKVLLPK